MRPLRLALLLAASTPGVFAAEPAPEKLPASTVAAKRPKAPATKSPTSGSRDDAATALAATPGGTNLIVAEDYERGTASTLRDALDYQPGIWIQARQGRNEARLSIRGSGLQRAFNGRGLLITQDGLPLNLADGSFDMQNLDPAAWDHIAVRRGANAFSQGAGTLGGAVDFVSKTGRDADLLRLGGEAGSFDYYRAVAASGAANEAGDYAATYSYTHTGGYRDNSGAEDHRVNTNAGVKLSDNAENRIYIGYADTATKFPGLLTKAQLETDPAQANTSNSTLQSSRDYTWFRLADRVAVDFDDGRVELAVGGQYKDLLNPVTTTVDAITDDFFLLAKADCTADLAGHKNRLTVGVTPGFGTLHDVRFVNPVGAADYGAKLGDANFDSTNLAAFIEDDLYLTRGVAVTAGVRADWARRDFTVNSATPAGPLNAGYARGDDRKKDYAGVSPRLGLRDEFDDNRQTVYANVAQSFEAPAFSDFAVSRAVVPRTLDAQTATTAELGWRGARGFAGWDIAVYNAWIRNELISFEYAPNRSATVNADDTVHRGVEAALDLDLLGGPVRAEHTRKIIFRQVCGWNDFRFAGDPVYGDNRIAGIPALTYRAELRYEDPCGFYCGPNIEAASRSWVDHANTLSADPYRALGFRAGYRSRKGVSVFAEGRNLTDRRYATTTGVLANARGLDAAQFSPADGASFFGGVEYRW